MIRPTPETDAAWTCFKGYMEPLQDVKDLSRKLERERDEARAVANELADIGSKHLSFLLAITPTEPNDKHEKETEKVIDALKRWKKL